jgi:hypothetical protein
VGAAGTLALIALLRLGGGPAQVSSAAVSSPVPPEPVRPAPSAAATVAAVLPATPTPVATLAEAEAAPETEAGTDNKRERKSARGVRAIAPGAKLAPATANPPASAAAVAAPPAAPVSAPAPAAPASANAWDRGAFGGRH